MKSVTRLQPLSTARSLKLIYKCCLMLVVCFASGTFDSSTALAQSSSRYLTLPITDEFKDPVTVKRMEFAAKQFAYQDKLDKFAETEAVRRYYSRYVPSKITQPHEDMSEISTLVTSIRKRMDRAARNKSPSHRKMMAWLYEGLKPVAQGNYHPAARVNAILLISHMDIQPFDRVTKTQPVPISVLPKLLMPIYQDPSTPDGVRAAALKGIRRYVKFAGANMRPTERRNLVQEMNRLIDSAAPTQVRTPEAHAYLQRFAVDILTSLRGETDVTLRDRLIGISTSKDRHDLIAFHSAARLVDVGKPQSTAIKNVGEVLSSWSMRAAGVLDAEIVRLSKLERPKAVVDQPRKPEYYLVLKNSNAMPNQGQRNAIDDGSDEGMGDDMEPDPSELRAARRTPHHMTPRSKYRSRRRFDVTQVQPPEVVMSRRKINHKLEQLHLGANGHRTSNDKAGATRGLAVLGDPAAKTVLADWIQAIESVAASVNGETLVDREQYLEMLRAQSTILKQLGVNLRPAKSVPVGDHQS